MNQSGSLLDCLDLINQHYGSHHSKSSIIAGLPLEKGELTPKYFVEAAEQMGYKAAIIDKELPDLDDSVLPVILLLKDETACIVKEIKDKTATITYSKDSIQGEEIPLKELKKHYVGQAIFIKKERVFDTRSKEYLSERSDSWFWSTLYRFKHEYMLIGFASLMTNAIALASPLFIMNVYDRVIPNSAISTLWALAFGIIIAFLFDFLIKQLRAHLLDKTGRKIDNILASKLMRQLLHIRSEYKPRSIGGFSNEINGYETIREFFTSATLATVFDFPFIFLFLWLVSFIGGSLALIPLLAIPIVVGVSIFLELPMRNALAHAHLATIQKHAALIESLIGLEQVKTLNAQGHMQKIWEKNVGIAATSGLHAKFFSSLIMNFTGYVMQMITVLTVIAGVYIIDGGRTGNEATLTMGALIACSILNARIIAPLSQLANLISRFQQARMGLESLNRVMERPSEIRTARDSIHQETIKGTIELNNVSFAYPEQQKATLASINFKIEAGQKVGIIGRIGSGKSTLLKLLLSIYECTDGTILFDGIDKGHLDVTDVRDAIGYVAQEPHLFYGTLRDNLLIGNALTTNKKMVEIAKETGLDQLAANHPDGYDMQIEERGENLSTGQRQLICITRALMSEPSILLLDEPTSAMDQQHEHHFMKMMKKMASNKTLIMITHKRQILELVDRVIIMDNGKMVMDGSKEDVLKSLASGQVKVKKS